MTAALPFPEPPYEVDIPVRWGDMDALGHVNNARFFTYDEDIRLGFFKRLMQDDAKFWKEYGLILAHIECDFLSQVKAPNTLRAHYGLRRLGGKSLETEARLYDGDVLAARTRAVVVCFDYRAQSTLALPPHVRERLEPFLLSDGGGDA